MTELTKLSLRSNPSMSGSLPLEYMTFPKMSKFAMSDMNLTGGIPESIGSLNPSGLKVLWLGEQPLQGSIPGSISLLTRMEQLHLHGAHLQGTIPSSLSSMRAFLTDVTLSSNNLTGAVPEELCELKQLEKLRLQDNKLERLPSCLAQDPSLELLSVCSPHASDTICFQCSQDTPGLNLANPKCACPASSHDQGNAFCGSVPSELSSITVRLPIEPRSDCKKCGSRPGLLLGYVET